MSIALFCVLSYVCVIRVRSHICRYGELNFAAFYQSGMKTRTKKLDFKKRNLGKKEVLLESRQASPGGRSECGRFHHGNHYEL